jgi:hypothetical protein
MTNSPARACSRFTSRGGQAPAEILDENDNGERGDHTALAADAWWMVGLGDVAMESTAVHEAISGHPTSNIALMRSLRGSANATLNVQPSNGASALLTLAESSSTSTLTRHQLGSHPPVSPNYNFRF